MEFDFDPGKDATNLSKHGFSLAAAAQLCWEAALVWIDDRAGYGELRMVALDAVSREYVQSHSADYAKGA